MSLDKVLRGSAHAVHLVYANDLFNESALVMFTSSKDGKAV